MRPEIAIRPETPDDYTGVEAVIMATMRAEESRLVELIRASPRYRPELTLDAVDASARVVGHVMVSDVDLVGESTATPVPCLAPLAMTPALQRTGVGSALVSDVLDIAETRGDPLIMVLGDASYYQRFGFERARPLGIDSRVGPRSRTRRGWCADWDVTPLLLSGPSSIHRPSTTRGTLDAG